MCIRRVLFCPACLRYGKLLKHTVPAEPGAIIRVIYEIPCGFSTCEWFNPVLSFIDLPILTAELQQPCSISCKWSLCQIMPIVEVCCDGKRSWHSYRLKQAEFHSPEAQVKRFLVTDHRFFGNEKAAAKFECSFGLLLHRVFWREERSRQKIELQKFFAVSTGEK